MLETVKRRRKAYITIGVLLAALVAIAIFVSSLGFHVVNTSPKLNNVSYLTPYIKVNFNRELVTKDISYASKNNIVTNFELENKTLTLYIDKEMEIGDTYTITIKNIKDTKGDIVKDKVLTFTTKDIEFSQLPQDQQDYIVNRPVADAAYSVDSISFVDFDYLTDEAGLPADQLDLLKLMIFGYSDRVLKQNFSQVTLDEPSLNIALHDVNSDDTTDKASFNLDVDGTIYKADISYSLIDSIFLHLYDASGNQVFQSDDLT